MSSLRWRVCEELRKSNIERKGLRMAPSPCMHRQCNAADHGGWTSGVDLCALRRGPVNLAPGPNLCVRHYMAHHLPNMYAVTRVPLLLHPFYTFMAFFSI